MDISAKNMRRDEAKNPQLDKCENPQQNSAENLRQNSMRSDDKAEDKDRAEAKDRAEVEGESRGEGKAKPNPLLAAISPVKWRIYLANFTNALAGVLGLFGALLLVFALAKPDSVGCELFALSKLGNMGFDLLTLSKPYGMGILLLALAMIFADFMLRGLSFFISHKAAFDLEEILRLKMAQNVSSTPLGEIYELKGSEIKKIISGSVSSLHSFVADSSPLLARSVFVPVLALLLMFFLDISLAFCALALLFVGFLLMKRAFKGNEEDSKSYVQNQNDINRASLELVQGMPDIRAFASGELLFSKFYEALDKYTQHLCAWIDKSAWASGLSMMILSPLSASFFLLILGLILGVDFAVLLAVMILANVVVDAIFPLMMIFNFLRQAGSAASELDRLLMLKKRLEYIEDESEQKDAGLVFCNVSAKYGSISVLEDVNIKIKPKSFVAFWGKSGSGKSTLAKLLLRFYEPSKGQILLHGKDIRSYEKLYERVSFVFQDSFFWDKSIRDNLLMMKKDASEQELSRALDLALCRGFVSSLELNPKQLSSGQRQRLAIARALLKDFDVLVLDEPSSFLDAKTQAELFLRLKNIDATVILISHRKELLGLCDEVFYFHDKGVSCGPSVSFGPSPLKGSSNVLS